MMMRYVIKRLLLLIPTLLLILLTNFAIVHVAPTGPVETQLAKIASEQHALNQQGFLIAQQVRYQGKDGLSDEMIDELHARFGFDKPAHERFWLMLKNYATFELGQSFFQGQSVASLLAQKLPISLAFGGLSLLVMYGAGVLLGVLKARFDGSLFDKLTALLLATVYALPVFLVALVLMVLFAGSRFWHIFPMQVVFAENFGRLPWYEQLTVAVYQLTLPVIASSLSGVASIAYLSKFGVLAEFGQPYVLAAKARGLTIGQIIYGHVIKNALMAVVAQMPMVVVGVLFAGNFLVEVIFGIDGLGRLGFEAVLSRDYPVMFGVLYVFTLISLLTQLLFDGLYCLLDPRISYH